MAISFLAHALTSQPPKMKAEMISLFYGTMTNNLIVHEKIVTSNHDAADDLKNEIRNAISLYSPFIYLRVKVPSKA